MRAFETKVPNDVPHWAQRQMNAMKAPAGSFVSLYYDARVRVEPGDFIVTGTGRTYHVVEQREQTKGKHKGRQHLRAQVMPDDFEPSADDVVHHLAWYRREKA